MKKVSFWLFFFVILRSNLYAATVPSVESEQVKTIGEPADLEADKKEPLNIVRPESSSKIPERKAKKRHRRIRKQRLRAKKNYKNFIAPRSSFPISQLFTHYDFNQAVESEVGYDILWDAPKGKTDLDRPYFSQKYRGELTSLTGAAGMILTAAYRLRGAKPHFHPFGRYEIDLRSLQAEWLGDTLRLNLGLQEVVWGEAFGFPIVDVVNPYDLTEYQIANRSNSRIPVAMLNSIINYGDLSLQLIYVPQPRRSPAVHIDSSLPRRDLREYKFGRSSEYGGRLSYLHSSGFDFKPFYYSHWSRLPVYQPVLNLNPYFLQIEKRVDSYGISFSKAFETIVIRSDLAEHGHTPFYFKSEQEIIEYKQQQGVIGMDFNSDNGESTVGAQVQVEDGKPRPDFLSDGPLFYGALRLTGSFFKSRLLPEVMIFKGLNNGDSWAKVKFAWNISAGLTFLSENDWMVTNGRNHPTYFRPQSKFFQHISYQF